MIPHAVFMLILLLTGAYLGWRLTSRLSFGIYNLYAEPAVARRGGFVFSLLIAVFVIYPALFVVSERSALLEKLQFLLPVGVVVLLGGFVGLIFLAAATAGWHAKLPAVGRSLNAYLLAAARANLAKAQRAVERYEEIDARLSPAATA